MCLFGVSSVVCFTPLCKRHIVFCDALLSMDFDHRVKGRTGSGPISDAQRQLAQRDRLLKLAMETSDISKVSPVSEATHA